MMKKTFGIIVSAIILSFVGSAPVHADQYSQPCNTAYGNTCQTETLLINKMVQHPTSSAFVENLGLNDPKFIPGQQVTFKIVVRNAGNSDIHNITVKDQLPDFVDFMTGFGTYDKNNKTLIFTIDILKAGESKEYTVAVRAKTVDQLPADTGVMCPVNNVYANSATQSVNDSTQFCIEKSKTKGGLTVFPAPKMTSTPATGAEDLALLALLPLGSIGMFLRKSSQKKSINI